MQGIVQVQFDSLQTLIEVRRQFHVSY